MAQNGRSRVITVNFSFSILLRYLDKNANLFIIGRQSSQIMLKNAQKTNSTFVEDRLLEIKGLKEVYVTKRSNLNGFDDIIVFISTRSVKI